MRPESATGLYWSIRGSVLCAHHVNDLDDVRWANENWAPLPASTQGFHGDTYHCQRCSPDGTALAHPRGYHSSAEMAGMIETLKRLCAEAQELQERLSRAIADSARNDWPAAGADPCRGDSRR